MNKEAKNKQLWVKNARAARKVYKHTRAARARYQFGLMLRRNQLPEGAIILEAIAACNESARAFMESREAKGMTGGQIEALSPEGHEYTLPADIAEFYGLEPGAKYDDLMYESRNEQDNQDNRQRLSWLGTSDEEFEKRSEEFRRQYESHKTSEARRRAA
jgi:hypothetical protein